MNYSVYQKQSTKIPKKADSLENYLCQSALIPEKDIRKVTQLSAETGDSLPALLVRLGLISEPELAKAYGAYLNLPVVQKRDMLIGKLTHSSTISHRFLYSKCIFPYTYNQKLFLAMQDPEDDFPPRAISYFFEQPCEIAVATQQDIEACIEQVYSSLHNATSPEAPFISEDDDIDKLRDLATEAPVIQLVQRLLTEAIESRCSDIHFEPLEDSLSIRFRIDGILQEVHNYPSSLNAPVISRIKILAQMNIAERRVPQDGRMRLTIHGKETDFRVVTAPTLHGESAVLRILDQRDVALDFDSLGFNKYNQQLLEDMLNQPHGIILVTGPTGSGKTTTLYAALNFLNTPARKILTAEDPIEYTLARINQVQVKPQIGHDFSNALRSFLRQDPDVIMVGEIRDKETMQMAVQASLTGHLLLSTLHTNSAAGAVTRLLDMGAEEYLLASTLRLVIGQRLVRRLCPDCRQDIELDSATKKLIALEIAANEKTPIQAYKPTGCLSCRGTGYMGRVSIIELLPINRDMETMILSRKSTLEIEEHAISLGMETMRQDGFRKVVAGLTSIEEVMRAVQNG
jgi:general secretion pathway protein E